MPQATKKSSGIVMYRFPYHFLLADSLHRGARSFEYFLCTPVEQGSVNTIGSALALELLKELE